MTKTEATKVLAILKAAYPNSYKGMTKEEGAATAMVWAAQFAEIPCELVMIAVNKIISTNTFPPSISEVKSRIKRLYWEAWDLLQIHKMLHSLDDRTVERLNRILEFTAPMQTVEKMEPSLTGLLNEYSQRFLEGGSDSD